MLNLLVFKGFGFDSESLKMWLKKYASDTPARMHWSKRAPDHFALQFFFLTKCDKDFILKKILFSVLFLNKILFIYI